MDSRLQHSKDRLLIFQQFKEIVSDLKQSDEILARFLRARDFNLTDAEIMIRNSVRWRMEYDTDNSKAWKFAENYPSDIGHRYFGRDYGGAPICWGFVGQWNAKELLESGNGDLVLRYTVQILEKGLALTIECNSPGYIIIDLDGLTYARAVHVPSIKLLAKGISLFEKNYPEISKSIIIINTPWIFSTMFNCLKGYIAPKTMKKIRVFGNKDEWLPELLEIFPRESIIPEYL